MAHPASLLRLSVAEKMSKRRDNALAVFERAQNNARLSSPQFGRSYGVSTRK
jgi:hypothetical protein